MTLEEKKERFRKRHGLPDDHPVFTPEEYEAEQKAKQTSSLGATFEGAKVNVIPGLGALGGLKAGMVGLSKLPLPGLAGKAIKGVGVIGSALIGDVIAREGQEAALDLIRTEDEKQAAQLKHQALRREHPIAYTVGEVGGSALGGGVGPSLKSAKGLGEFVKTAGGVRGKPNKEVINYALTNVGIGGGMGLAFEGGRQIGEGEFLPGALISSTVGGALFTKPVLHGRKLLGPDAPPVSEADATAQTRSMEFAEVTPREAKGQQREFLETSPEPRIDKLEPEEVYFQANLTPQEQQAKIQAYIEAHQIKEKGDAVKKSDEVSTDSSAKEATRIHRKDFTEPDPAQSKALSDFAKKQGVTEYDPKLPARLVVEKHVKTEVDKAVDGLSETKLNSLERQARLGAAGEYLQTKGITKEEVRAALKKKVNDQLGDAYESVRNLAAKRGLTLRVATKQIVDSANNLVLGFAPRNGREVILSLNDMNPEVAYHEMAHVFIRDLVGSSNKAESDGAIKWLKDLYADHPSINVKKGEAFTEAQKNKILELFAQDVGERLDARMRNLPKGKFDKMRRWIEDVNRGRTVRYGEPAKKEILDYVAQRMEIDRNPLLDVDINAAEGTKLDKFVKTSLSQDLQLGITPDDSHTGSLTVDGVKYTSTANAYAIPKEVTEIFNIPDMPDGFAKKYVDNLNRLKSGIVNKTEYVSDLDYLEMFNLAELPNYEANYTRMMKNLQKRNTGALKQIFKMFEDDPVNIVLETKQPDIAPGSHDADEIRIGVPTIDNNFDMVLAQHLLNRHLINNKVALGDLTGLWGRLISGESWLDSVEPELITRFLNFAARNDLPDEFKNILSPYYRELDIANINLSTVFGGSKTWAQAGSMEPNYKLYGDRMLGQGNSLQGALRALPDDIRMKFANSIVGRSRAWQTADEFLRDFDAIVDTFGVSGSKVRKDFYDITRSPQHVLYGMLNKGTYDALDGLNTLWPKVSESATAMPNKLYDLKKYWAARDVPVEESAFAKMPAIDAITQLAESATGIKGLKNVFERVTDTPMPPRTSKAVDFSLGKVVSEVSESDVDKLMQGIPTSGEKVTPVKHDKWVKRERELRFKTLPDPKLREPLTWKPLQRALRGMRPIVDRVRELGLTKESKKLAHYVADRLNATQKDENLLRGQFHERVMLAFSDVKLTPDEFNTLGDFQLDRWRAKVGLDDAIDPKLMELYTANPRLRYFDRMMENIYRDTRQYQNDIGMLVEAYRGGKRSLGPGKFTPEYTPEIISQEVRSVLMKVTKESDEHQALKKEAVEYWMSIAKKSDKDEIKTALSDVDGVEKFDPDNEAALRGKFEVMFDNMANSLKATQHTIGSQKYKALRVATGRFGIPKRWVERNAFQRLTRYVVRFTKDAAFFKNIEGDETARKILGIPDQMGNYADPDIAGLEKGGPFNLRNIVDGKIVSKAKGKTYQKDVMSSEDSLDAFMQGYIGFYENWDLWSRTFNRMVTSSWLGVGAGIRDFVSSYMFALPYMRTQDLPLLVTHLFKWKDAWVKSHLMGVNKTALNNLEWTQQSVNEVTDGINKAADVMLVIGGRSVLERNTRALQFSLGRQLTSQALRQGMRLTEYIGIGDWTANRLLRSLDQQMGGGANYQGRRRNLSDWVGQKAPDEVLDQAAAAWVEMNQGTYDVRGLPKFTQRGVPSMFTSLARWSIEKSDRMAKDIWMPMINQGDLLPLIKATFGAVLGGEGIKYLSEMIANKMQSDPKLIEAIQMDNPKEQLQAILNSVSFAGFFGIQSSILHDLVRASRYGVLEGIPGGLTFPAANALYTIAGDLSHLLSSGEAFNDGFARAWTKFFRNSMMGLNQSMRYAAQHIFLSDDMSEFNARAQLRKFRRLERGYVKPGVPSGISNPFDWPSRSDFKKATSVAEARRLLPAAVREAAEKAVALYPDNPGRQAVQFKENWQALYGAQWSSTPALPSTREEHRHLERIRYLGLKASPEVEAKLYRKKPKLLGSERLGKKAVDIAGGEITRGTVISKSRAKKLMKQEKEFFYMTQHAKNLVLRYISSGGKVY